MALIAGTTERIRVGTAGVLFHYYPPSRIAFDFQSLERCFSGRIDAGFCAGRIADADLERDQLDGRDRDAHLARYEARVAAFTEHLRAGLPPGDLPEIWSFGSGLRSARCAARHGIRFGYSLFHQWSVDDPQAVDLYRSEFIAARAGEQPYTAIAVAGACAPTDDQARQIAGRHQNPFFVLNVVGSPSVCRQRLCYLAWRYGVEEIAFATLCGEYDERLASHRLLAEAMAG